MTEFLKKKEYFKQLLTLFFIIFIFSKEIVVNDYEIVIIYCLLSFIIISYFNFRNVINNIFDQLINDIQSEYKDLSFTILVIEKKIKKIIFSYKLIFFFLYKLYLLSYRALHSFQKHILDKTLLQNLLLINLSSLKTKINLENRKRLNLGFFNKINTLLYFSVEKPFLIENKLTKGD
jgi:hypothetical protein